MFYEKSSSLLWFRRNEQNFHSLQVTIAVSLQLLLAYNANTSLHENLWAGNCSHIFSTQLLFKFHDRCRLISSEWETLQYKLPKTKYSRYILDLELWNGDILIHLIRSLMKIMDTVSLSCMLWFWKFPNPRIINNDWILFDIDRTQTLLNYSNSARGVWKMRWLSRVSVYKFLTVYLSLINEVKSQSN